MRRFWASAALAVLLVLPLAALATSPVVAAPPNTDQEAAAESASSDIDAGTDSETASDPPGSTPQHSSAPLPDEEVPLIEDSPAPERVDSDSGSIRPRGLEAPVELGQQREDQGGESGSDDEREPEEPNGGNDNEVRDPGDGPVRKSERQEAPRERDRAPQEIRVWPMPADSYTFTQQFGCVQQLGNLYFPGEGCPADAPVVHTGVDLAAPEGTPFYAAASGWVTLAGFDRPTADANTRIIIQHDGRNEGFATDYLHWIASYVEEGDYVHAGDPIGEVGSVGFSTGPHLHFSVTNLDTGEHVDPVRWVPGEPGLDGYAGRRPNAQLRLPPGTTAGQPESADPSPPPPPTREDVPDTPPGESGDRRDRSERRSERTGEERRADKRDEAKGDSKKSGKKRSRRDAPATEASPETPAEERTNKNERDRPRERERTRERNKDGSRSAESDNGEDGRNRDNQEGSDKGDRRRDRDTGNDSSDDGKQKRDDGERSDAGGRGDGGGRDERTGGRQGQNHDSVDNNKGSGRDRKNRA